LGHAADVPVALLLDEMVDYPLVLGNPLTLGEMQAGGP
jgi:hypothetical protein